jgi:predicted permease
MKNLGKSWIRFRSLWRRPAVKREIDEELRFHLEQRTAENLAAGITPEEAAREARKRFGNVQTIREECREVRGANCGETTLQDVRFGLRMLRKNPGFTAVAVLSLAVGIGVNTAIFSLLNALLLRALPVSHPHALRVVNWVGRNAEMRNFSTTTGLRRTATGLMRNGSFPYPVYQSFRDRGAGFAEVFAFYPVPSVTAVANREAFNAGGLMVSGNFLTGYGARTLVGRAIAPEDDQPNAAPVVMITYRWWERFFALDPNIVGQTVSLNKNRFTIIGVLPRDFLSPFPGDMADFYVPLSAQPQLAANFPLASANHWWVEIMARLAPDASQAQAQASLEVIFRQMLPMSDSKMDQPGIWLTDGSRGVSNMIRNNGAGPLWGLLALVSLVLLVACANVANLLLARGAARSREMAVRTAIGAGRWRLIRQSLTESLVLTLAGGLLGLVLASWGKTVLLRFLLGFLNSLLPGGNLRFDARTDMRILAFTLGLSVLAALLFGLIPALRAARTDPAAALKDHPALGAPRRRLGRALVSLQVGISVLLVVLTGLVVQTFANLNHVNPGFNPENLLLFQLDATQTGYDGQRGMDFYESVRQSVAAIPGVRAVALSDLALGSGSEASSAISIVGRSTGPDDHSQAWQLVVSDSFFSTMGIALLQGRDLAASDTSAHPKVAVVNETFVRSFLPAQDPLGKSFQIASDPYQIVGVCRDAKYQNLRNEAPPTMYLSYRQTSPRAMYFEIRSALPPLSLVPAVRQAVAGRDPNVPLAGITTQRRQIDQSIAPERLFASLGSFLALVAVLLSFVGLYGLMAYNVARRTGEIGIRMALGATRRNITWPILREAVLLAAAGLAVGVPVALAVAHLLRSVLFGIQPYDPATLLGSVLLLTGVAVIAAWIPARRAAKVAPMAALRYE